MKSCIVRMSKLPFPVNIPLFRGSNVVGNADVSGVGGNTGDRVSGVGGVGGVEIREGDEIYADKGEIYMITNKVTGMKYIGQTKCLHKKNGKYVYCGFQERFKEHIRNAFSEREETRTSVPKLYEAMRSVGRTGIEGVFEVSMLERCQRDMMNEREKYYIRLHRCRRNGYNVTAGGQRPRGKRRRGRVGR